MLRDGLAQLITDHAEVVRFTVFCLGKVIINYLESGFSVVIIRIDDGEGCAVNGLLGTKHCVTGTPGLGPEKDYDKKYEYAKELYDYYMEQNNDFDINNFSLRSDI